MIRSLFVDDDGGRTRAVIAPSYSIIDKKLFKAAPNNTTLYTWPTLPDAKMLLFVKMNFSVTSTNPGPVQIGLFETEPAIKQVLCPPVGCVCFPISSNVTGVYVSSPSSEDGELTFTLIRTRLPS